MWTKLKAWWANRDLIEKLAISLLAGLILFSFVARRVEADHTIRHAVTATVHKMHNARQTCGAVMIAPERAMTAAHCLGMESPVLTIDGVDYPLTEGYAATPRDVAVLIVPGAPCPCAALQGKAVEAGDWVVVVGYPYNLAQVVTYGEVQARIVNPEDGQEYVLATASVAPGNSGGGVFNVNGYLVGITSMSDDRGAMLLFVEVLTVPYPK